MLKKISKINGASTLEASNQKKVNGGIVLSRLCNIVCTTASSGTPCGPFHCPGVCLGGGRYVLY